MRGLWRVWLAACGGRLPPHHRARRAIIEHAVGRHGRRFVRIAISAPSIHPSQWASNASRFKSIQDATAAMSLADRLPAIRCGCGWMLTTAVLFTSFALPCVMFTLIRGA